MPAYALSRLIGELKHKANYNCLAEKSVNVFHPLSGGCCDGNNSRAAVDIKFDVNTVRVSIAQNQSTYSGKDHGLIYLCETTNQDVVLALQLQEITASRTS